MSKLWLSSDPHFGHYTNEERGVIQFCGRPWPAVPGTPEMNEALIESYQVVGKDDRFIFLGDMFFRTRTDDMKKIMDRIPGEKILIRGNHDDRKSNKKWMELGFTAVFRHMSWFDERLGCDVVLNHDPVASIVVPDAIVLCGHVHQLWKTLGRCINVGVDVWDFKPITYEDDILPLAQTLVDVPFSEFADNEFDKPFYDKRRALVEGAISTAPHLGTISDE